MLTLNDGRKEMYQWDIGRIATIDVECDVVHFSNLKYGASLSVEVKNGEVAIPNKLLTSGEPIYCWAFVSDENGNYTKQEQTLNVNKRAKPSDYVYTETETLTWKSLDERITELEKGGTTSTMTGATADTDGASGLVPAPKAGEQEKFLRGDGTWADVIASGGLTSAQISALDGLFKIAAYTEGPSTAYSAFKSAFGISDSGGGESGGGGETEKTLESISATYTGGDVEVSTALSDLIGITVTATYSDGSTETVTGYTLSGEIAEGENTITVSYSGLTTTFTVVGIASENNGWTDGVPYAIEWIDGYAIDHNGSMGAGEAGSVYELSGRSVTDYLPCNGANRISVTNMYTNYGSFYYDENKVYIDRYVQNDVSDTEPVVLRNAYYVRFQKVTTKDASAIPHNDPILTENTSFEPGKHYRLSWKDGYTLNNGVESENMYNSTSDYAFCYGATELQYSQTTRTIFFFFDSEKNFLESIIRQNKTEPITIPSGAKYFRTTGTIYKSNDWVTLA